MINEIIIIGVVIWVIFGGYLRAKTYEIHENARKQEIENDKKELE